MSASNILQMGIGGAVKHWQICCCMMGNLFLGVSFSATIVNCLAFQAQAWAQAWAQTRAQAWAQAWAHAQAQPRAQARAQAWAEAGPKPGPTWPKPESWDPKNPPQKNLKVYSKPAKLAIVCSNFMQLFCVALLRNPTAGFGAQPSAKPELHR